MARSVIGHLSAWVNALVAALTVVGAGFVTPAWAQTPPALDVVRRLADAGAIDVALERIGQSQPPEASAAGWADWELLRLDLLFRRGRNSELLKRVANMRNIALSDRSAAQLWLLAARAAARDGQSVQVRDHYARYFLRAEPGTSEYRDARFAVIESYVSDRNPDEAYRLMLRFQQDFAPLRREEAERFVSALISFERIQDAATWLPQLDKASPAATVLRLRAGLINADSAIAQARALMAKGVGEPALMLLSEASAAKKDRATEIEVHEIRLQIARPEPRPDQVAALWKRYAEAGPPAGDQLHLLVGDDNAWVERAERLSPTQPQIARALLGHIASNARQDEARARAQLLLVASLRDGKLPLTALRLFSDPKRFPVGSLDARVRYALGSVAADNKSPAEAVRYWQNLALPAGLSAQEWQVRYLAVLFKAGMVDAGLQSAKSLIAPGRALSPELVARLAAVASDALDVWHVRPAETLYTMLLPLSSGAERIEVLFGLGRVRELTGEFRLAADAFLTAAALAAAPESNRTALRAREHGAINLAKAGMLEDARATYRWLAENAKDPAIRENAARSLSALPE